MTERARHYPQLPPSKPGESPEDYTRRLQNPQHNPYDHIRFRQCSIAFHEECPDAVGKTCKCPCHYVVSPEPRHDDPMPFAVIWPDRATHEDWLEASGVMFHNRVAVTIDFVTNAMTSWPDINLLLESIGEREGLSFVWLDGWS